MAVVTSGPSQIFDHRFSVSAPQPPLHYHLPHHHLHPLQHSEARGLVLRTKNKNGGLGLGLGLGNSRLVFCMAHPRRVKMVAQQIKREIGDMMIKDKNLQQAMAPETALGADLYLSSVTTVSDVVLSNDLQVAKVYVSIYSDERGKELVMEGLKAKTKYVRAGLGKRMQLRLTPEVRFIMDESLEKGSRVLSILDRLQKEREAKGDQKEEEDDDDNWDDIVEEDDQKE